MSLKPVSPVDPAAPPQSSEEILARIQARTPAAARRLDADQQPRTDTERTLAAIWAELLRVDAVGIREDFFQLGGHSLLAVQMLVRVRDRYQAELPMHVLFASTEFTIERLADAVERHRRQPGEM